jgi:hypothetical protein
LKLIIFSPSLRVSQHSPRRTFAAQVAGQAEGTANAKQWDLACFLSCYVQLYDHDDRREWHAAADNPTRHA